MRYAIENVVTNRNSNSFKHTVCLYRLHRHVSFELEAGLCPLIEYAEML